MDWLDAATAQPWDTLACFEELHIEVEWPNTAGCDVVQFPVARLLPGSGLLGFATSSDAACFSKGGLGAVTDVVMKISWEPRRGGGSSETRPRVAVIAPGIADDGAFGTLACPPTPSEEMWAALALHVLPILAQEARYGGVGAPAEAADIWATVGNVQARAEADVRLQDLASIIKGTISISGIPKGASPASAARSGARSTGAGGFALPFSARTALSTGRTFDSTSLSTSVNRIVPRMRERQCRHCGSAMSVPNSSGAAQADPSQGSGPITCRCCCAFYCTTRCQALDWSAGHDVECAGFAAAHAAVRDMASLPFFPYIDDVTRLISAGATCICEVLTCWGLHDGVPAWRFIPGCACITDEPSPDTSGAATHLRPLSEAPNSRSSRALSLFSSCRSWNELYAMLKLPSAAPDAMVYTHAATL